eukprot:10347898-Alexandrium_andersonii.AAC.1
MGRRPGGTKSWLLCPGGRLRLGRLGVLQWKKLLPERLGLLESRQPHFVPSPGGVDGQMQRPHIDACRSL